MPIYGARGGFLSTADWEDLARKITNGDGLGWPGDPRMRLEVGILRETGPNGRLREGHRLEVHRHNEDGSDTLVAHWLPREQHMVCYDLARMRVDSPGHESIEDRIDQHNAKLEKKASDEYRDAMGAMLEHAAALHHDLNNPRNTFFYDRRVGAK